MSGPDTVMRAMVMSAFGDAPVITEVPLPRPPEGGVVVRVLATGLCRSDWYAWAGHDDDVRLPHVPGHEFAGVIAEVGSGVRDWAPGDRVTSPFVEGCGQCTWCRAAQAQICPRQTQPGFTHWGSFAEFVALRASDVNLVRVPDSISFEAAASLGCRFATAYHGLTDRARLQTNEWVTVVGAGGVGLSTVMIAKALGAQVIAVDRHAEALELAAALGADHLIESTSENVSDQVRDLTGGGSHVGVDAVGLEATAEASILSLRRRGRHLQIGLFAPLEGRLPGVPMNHIVAWELQLLGSHGMAAVDYPGMLALIEAGALAPQRLIERVISLDAAAEQLPRMDAASPAGMTMIDPWA